jgi:hypothetical protein
MVEAAFLRNRFADGGFKEFCPANDEINSWRRELNPV